MASSSPSTGVAASAASVASQPPQPSITTASHSSSTSIGLGGGGGVSSSGGGTTGQLSLRVESLADLLATLPGKGQHAFGNLFSDRDGKWVIQFYPHGDSQSREGHVSVFLKNIMLPQGFAAVKIEGNIRIVVEDGSVRVTKAFSKSTAYLNPNADGLATSSSWGYHEFCLLSELPPSFTIEADIIIKETARDDVLALHIPSFADLKARLPKGQSTLGFVWNDSEGQRWTLCLYPNGDNLSRENEIGVFVKVLSMGRGVTAIKIEGNLRILQGAKIVSSRTFPMSTWMNASGTGMASSSTWGFHGFCLQEEVPESFIVEADIVIKEVAREPSFQEVPDDYSVSRLLECIKVAHGRELEEAKNARRMLNEAQLRSLSLDQLLEMQENISLIIKEKRTQENECSVCQDRVKSMALVPCGHRFCCECCSKITQCPECRTAVTQRIRLF